MKNKLKVLTIVLSLGFGSVIPNAVRDLSVNGRDAFAEVTSDGKFLTLPAPSESEDAQTSGDSSANPFIEEDGLTVINPAFENNKKAENIQQITGIGQQIAQSGSGFTKDPKVAAYVAAGGSAIGATGALIGSAYHFDRAGKYGKASERNSAAAKKTQDDIDDAQSQIDEAQIEYEMQSRKAHKASFYSVTDKEAKAVEFAAAQKRMAELEAEQALLKTKKTELAAKLTAQESLAGDQTFSQVGGILMGSLGVISSAAMAGTGVMQLEQGRQLASDNEYCAKHPNEFPRCTEVAPQGDNSPLNPLDQNPPTSLNDPGFSGFERSGADEDKFSPVSASAAGLTSPIGAAGGPSFGGGLSGGSGEDRNPAKEKEELDDIGGSGFSGDQTYEGGGGNIDQLGSGAVASSLMAPPFDISQFLPANLREDEFGGPYAAKINDKEKEEQRMVLGKESPSLFTRINRAYQKRAHEMLKGVI